MMKAMLWAFVLALVLAYAGWGVEIVFPFLVIACAMAFYHHSQVAGAASVAVMTILAGFLYASGMRQIAFGVSEISLGMLIAATAVAAWKLRNHAAQGVGEGAGVENAGTKGRSGRKRINAHATGRAG